MVVVNALLGQLEVGALDEAADALARRVAEAEAKVDVEKVARLVEHQVAIVSVAQLEDPHDDRVRGAANKYESGYNGADTWHRRLAQGVAQAGGAHSDLAKLF